MLAEHIDQRQLPLAIFEQELLYFIMFSFLRKENYGKFGIEDGQTPSDEEKIELMTYRSIKQENALRRDFIIHFLSQTSGDRKRHEKIEERIRELKPFSSKNAEEAVVVLSRATGTCESRRNTGRGRRIV